MNQQIKIKILTLANQHEGRASALDVRTAARIIGINERAFRQCVIELFEEGYDVMCLPRAQGLQHGFCSPSTEDMGATYNYQKAHCLTLLSRLGLIKRRIHTKEKGQLKLAI